MSNSQMLQLTDKTGFSTQQKSATKIVYIYAIFNAVSKSGKTQYYFPDCIARGIFIINSSLQCHTFTVEHPLHVVIK